jgi:hypothetical protein
MTGLTTPPTRSGDDPAGPTTNNFRSVRERKSAFWVFVVAQAMIFVALIWNFHGRWFVADEWVFIAGRTAGSVSDLLHPYHEHWSTLPILYYRLLWNLVGIRSYMPYLVSIVTLHIAVSSLLRAVMIRASVLPWLATLSALSFSLYGAGYADISYGFNIGFDGSIVFGLLYLLAVDHAGPADRRDVLGVTAGLAALMCSGIGVTMVIVVAIAVSIRHGLRRALLVTLPLAGAYIVWFVAVGNGAYSRHSSVSELARFIGLGLAFTFSSLGHSPVAGVALAVLLIAGVVITVCTTGLSELRARYGAPCALLIGVLAFVLITGFGRANNALASTDTYAASRYLYVIAALLVPALAVAATQLILTWRGLWPVMVIVLVVGIPGNVAVLHRMNYLHTLDSYRQFMLSIPRLPDASHLPGSIHPDPYFDSSVTLGWLLAGVQSGRIPPPSPSASVSELAYWTLRLAWYPAPADHSGACRSAELPVVTRMESGTRVTVDAPVYVAYLYRLHQASMAIRLPGGPGSSTYTSSWPMEVRITPTAPWQSVVLCDHR